MDYTLRAYWWDWVILSLKCIVYTTNVIIHKPKIILACLLYKYTSLYSKWNTYNYVSTTKLLHLFFDVDLSHFYAILIHIAHFLAFCLPDRPETKLYFLLIRLTYQISNTLYNYNLNHLWISVGRYASQKNVSLQLFSLLPPWWVLGDCYI